MPSATTPFFTSGLRSRLSLLVLAICGAVFLLAMALGKRITTDMADDMGSSLARTQAQLTREKLRALIGREVALTERLADLTDLRQWLGNETDERLRKQFQRQAEGFRTALIDSNYFLVSNSTLSYYFVDDQSDDALRPRYTLHADNPADKWFARTLAGNDRSTLNVDTDAPLKLTRLWINIQIRGEHGERLGLTGTGLKLNNLLQDILSGSGAAATNFIVNDQGWVVAHPDPAQIEYGAAGKTTATKTVYAMLPDPQDRERLHRLLPQSGTSSAPLTVRVWTADGPRILALSGMPELGWTVVSAVAPDSSLIFTAGTLQLAIGGALTIVVVLLLALTLGFDRLVLHPLLTLTASVRRMEQGNYDIPSGLTGNDEIGELSRAFDAMAATVRSHTRHLEQRVAERTAQLEASHSKVTESIRYASLLQQIILPEPARSAGMHGAYFALWRPRDVVGGDFYLYREMPGGCLFGVVDCAGHGVPGAFMTMLAHAALERAVAEQPGLDPVRLLERIDTLVRSMMPESSQRDRLATSMDMGLCSVDHTTGALRFAGAHIDLFLTGKESVTHIRGGRGGINDRRQREFAGHDLVLTGQETVYLATDGILDQVGGSQGLPFGRSGFLQWLEDTASRSLEEQQRSLIQTLDAYQGHNPQRDDITVLAFRLNMPASKENLS